MTHKFCGGAKQVNDRFGHAVGDRVLRQAAKTVKEALRTEDTLGRIGGEEFCVLLPQADRAAAAEIAERIRQAVAAQAMAHQEGEPFAVTVSIGVVTIEASMRDWGAVFHQVDEALYRAKQGGRNCVVAAGSPPPAVAR